MNSVGNFLKENEPLHHAYIIEGEREAIFSELVDFFENSLKIATRGNPDFWHNDFESFSIDDGRALKEMQSHKSFGGKKIFIIKTNSITTEAQNSILKIFEEPTADTHFFIIMPSAELLLPTLKSRVVSFRHNGEKKNASGISAGNFMNASLAERLSMIDSIIKEKDKSQAIIFLDDLQKHIWTKIKNDRKLAKKFSSALAEMLKAKKWLSGRSPSVKIILEHISVILPLK